MTKNFLLALAMLLTFANADAQFGNLVNKAKNKVKEKVETTSQSAQAAADEMSYKPSKAALAADPAASDETVGKGYTKSSAYRAGFYEQLDKKLFPFQPYYTADNLVFYQPDSLWTLSVYADFCDKISRQGSMWTDYISRPDGSIVPKTDMAYNSYMANFLADPESLTGYGQMVRCEVMKEAIRFGYVDFTSDKGDANSHWLENDTGEKLQLMESDNERRSRWSKVFDLCKEKVYNVTPFNIIGTHAVSRMKSIEKYKAKGDPESLAIAVRNWRELKCIMEDAENSKLNPKDENYRQLKIQYEKYSDDEMQKLADNVALANSDPVAMPKGCTVSAELQNAANEQGRKRWGDNFVKAIFTTNSWQIFKNPNFPYDIKHRSMNVDFITKENGIYLVNHWVLKQYYVSNNKYGRYDIMAQMVNNITQKVNYK